jgi:hypothetical protein
MNTGRIFGGGLVAGVLMTVLDVTYLALIGERLFHASLERLAVRGETGQLVAFPIELTAVQAVYYPIANLVLGVILVWMYAAVRPRFGPGLRTALSVGLVGGTLIFLIPGLSLMACGLYPPDPLGPIWNPLGPWILWGMVQTPVATVGGAYLYREGGAREFA